MSDIQNPAPVPPESSTNPSHLPEASISAPADGPSKDALIKVSVAILKLRTCFSMFGSALEEFSLALAELAKLVPNPAPDTTSPPSPDACTTKNSLAPSAPGPCIPRPSSTPTENPSPSTGTAHHAKPTASTNAGKLFPKACRRRQAERIADLVGCDVADLRDAQYKPSEYYSPKVYVVGDDYFAASDKAPLYHVGEPWEALSNFRGETVWRSKMSKS